VSLLCPLSVLASAAAWSGVSHHTWVAGLTGCICGDCGAPRLVVFSGGFLVMHVGSLDETQGMKMQYWQETIGLTWGAAIAFDTTTGVQPFAS